MFQLLVRSGADELPADEIARTLDVPHSTLSIQLTILANAGLVRSRRDGRSIIYTVEFETMRELLTLLMEDCCQGNPQVCAPLLETLLPIAHEDTDVKRLHVNLSVESLGRSVDFSSTLFDQPPTVLKTDYAKWMLDDPRGNFAISTRSARKGLDHLSIQAEEPTDLEQATRRLRAAQAPVMEQGATDCGTGVVGGGALHRDGVHMEQPE